MLCDWIQSQELQEVSVVCATEFFWLLGSTCWIHPCIYQCLGVLSLIVYHCHSLVLSSAVLNFYFSLFSIFSFCSLFWFDSLSAFSFFCFRDISCFIRDDDWVLLNSLIPTVSLAVSLEAFVILFQVVSGISFSCIFTSNLVWRSLLYFWLISGSVSLFTSSLSDFSNFLLCLHHSKLIFALTSLRSVVFERLP